MQGFKGVCQRGKKFMVQFHLDGKTVSKGVYETPEEAHAVYLALTIDRNKERLTPVDFIEGEIWKIFPKDNRYSISSFGRIKCNDFRHTGIESLLKLKKEKSGGYYSVHIRPRIYKVHRLVWDIFMGEYDTRKKQVNHIDGDKSNNRLDNLELVYIRENQSHSQQKIHSKTKTGCYFQGHINKWVAQISYNGKQRYLGSFLTQDEAHQRYLQEVASIGETNKYSY